MKYTISFDSEDEYKTFFEDLENNRSFSKHYKVLLNMLKEFYTENKILFCHEGDSFTSCLDKYISEKGFLGCLCPIFSLAKRYINSCDSVNIKILDSHGNCVDMKKR